MVGNSPKYSPKAQSSWLKVLTCIYFDATIKPITGFYFKPLSIPLLVLADFEWKDYKINFKVKAGATAQFLEIGKSITCLWKV